MRVGELFYRLDQAGINLTYFPNANRLNAKPTAALTPDLIEEIKQHKKDLIQVMREDEAMRRTGIIQSERQVFELAREFFGADVSKGDERTS